MYIKVSPIFYIANPNPNPAGPSKEMIQRELIFYLYQVLD